MNELIAALIVLCYSFATGIFYVLSCLEKPVWPLMRNPDSEKAADKDARFVHQALQRLIPLLPPTMVTTTLTGLVLLALQSVQRDFDRPSLIILVFFLVMISYLFSRLRGCIKGVSQVPHDGDIAGVRDGTGRLAALHHTGLFTMAGVLLLQFFLIIG